MDHIRIDHQGAVGILTIARRERFNSLDVETAQDLRKAGLQLARDREVRAVVLRGDGGVFCSGADLKYIRDGGDGADLGYLRGGASAGAGGGYGAIFKQILEYLHSTISEIRRAAKPFVAAVDGPAAAGGFGLAMSCDLVVASERAWFEWAYFKTGLTGAESSTFFLTRLLGFHKAMELALLSPRLTAAQALDLGLINAVHPDADLDAAALALATRLAEAPTTAVGVAKRLLNRAAGMDRLDVHLDAELTELARIADGPNFAEGLDAFFARREPRFGVE
ncbi:MAG: enoyl-CoA hydratase/isomerase family protein [Kofleriaceae bacterium]|nr:enoyl-CoA hydratase/isomerase family protein [Myxococcales bacterium]MCB9563957.1 enoyl-CoA hydratase/isomerase family protein [Kofleriaceae bacterium]